MTKGEKIKSAREAANLTQEELGRACGTTKQTIYKYENDIVSNIPLDRLEAIAKAVGVSSAYIMGWNETTDNLLLKTAREKVNGDRFFEKTLDVHGVTGSSPVPRTRKKPRNSTVSRLFLFSLISALLVTC